MLSNAMFWVYIRQRKTDKIFHYALFLQPRGKCNTKSDSQNHELSRGMLKRLPN